MSNDEYQVERLAHKLAGKLAASKSVVRDSIAPPGQRPPFTTQMAQSEALGWWQAHINDDLGKKVLANMTPNARLELRLALTQREQGDVQSTSDSGL